MTLFSLLSQFDFISDNTTWWEHLEVDNSVPLVFVIFQVSISIHSGGSWKFRSVMHLPHLHRFLDNLYARNHLQLT